MGDSDERLREEQTGSDVKLGYIGLGNMGAPMAKRLVEWPGGLVVFDVRAEAMTPLAEKGATRADSVADVAAADVISVAATFAAGTYTFRCRLPSRQWRL